MQNEINSLKYKTYEVSNRASGFIGSYLFREIVNAGHEVLALKRSTTNLFRIDDCKDKARWIEESPAFEQELIAFKPEIIYHLAWKGVAARERVDWAIQESNIQMFQKLLDIAKECGTKKFVGVIYRLSMVPLNQKMMKHILPILTRLWSCQVCLPDSIENLL